MATLLYGGIKRRYERDGYAVIPNVFSGEECRTLLEEVERIASFAPGAADVFRVRDLGTYQRSGISKKQSGDQYFIIGELPMYSALMAAFVGDRRIAAIAATALGGRGIATPVRYHFSNITNKPARIGPRLRWHRDFPNTFITMRAAQFCRVMVCLDGMTKRNGPTAFVPGTHGVSDSYALRTKRRKYPNERSRERLALCPPGAVVLFHPKVRHGGDGNRSGDHRRNMIVQWGKRYGGLVATSLEKWSSATPEALRSGAAPPHQHYNRYPGR